MFLWNNCSWKYETKFDFNVTDTYKEIFLVFEGVKMGANISLNSQFLGSFKDQHLRYVFAVGKILKSKSNVLELTFPSGGGVDAKVSGRYMSCSGGWDWAPVTPEPSTLSKGIWKSVYLSVVKSVAITHVVPHIFYLGEYPKTTLTNNNHGGFLVDVKVHIFSPSAVKASV